MPFWVPLGRGANGDDIAVTDDSIYYTRNKDNALLISKLVAIEFTSFTSVDLVLLTLGFVPSRPTWPML